MAQRRILVVDDEENIGRSLRLILEREGYAVNLCSSIAEAKAFPQRPDVYLLDVKLADGTGIEQHGYRLSIGQQGDDRRIAQRRHRGFAEPNRPAAARRRDDPQVRFGGPLGTRLAGAARGARRAEPVMQP